MNTGTDSRDVKDKGKSDWSFGAWEIMDLCFNSGCLSATMERYFVNDNCSVVLRGLFHVPADLTSEIYPG